ncbi:Nn.00g096170.m01.CDS01 [Neocucurbitaria sp. VM-36]
MLNLYHSFVTLLALLAGDHVQAQQFAGFGTAMGVGWEGISTTCGIALNSTVSCPILLHEGSLSNHRWEEQNLIELCTASCLDSLTSARNNIIAGCKGPNDIEKRDAGLTYPATFVVDHYILTYNLACRKDPATNRFCDVLGTEWLSNTKDSSDHDCHDCVLGTMQTHLNSPLDYSEESEEDFRRTTASCSKTQYPITRPGEYAIGTWGSETPVPTPTCLTPLSLGGNDTCETVSMRYNVSTSNILSRNSIPWTACQGLGSYGSLCLPEECAIHKLDPMDTCENITAQYGVTDVQFLAWNPNINALCNNLEPYVGDYVCVGPPDGSLAIVTPTVSMPVVSPTLPASIPSNAHPDSNKKCGRWYEIQKGDICQALSIEFGISLRAFYFLNPQIDSQCSNLWLETSYCVQPVGDMASYPGFSTSNFITLTPTSFETATASSFPLLAMTLTATSQLPLASGTVEDCYEYRNHVPIPAIVDQAFSNNIRPVDTLQNDCEFVSSKYNVELDQLLEWNPSLSSSECELKNGSSYCVLRSETSGRWIPGWYERCASKEAIDNAGVIVDGVDSDCDCFAVIDGSDMENEVAMTCEDLVDSLKLPVANIAKYNSWIGSDCDANLYAGLMTDQSRAVCIGKLGIPTATAGATPRPTSSSPPTCTFDPNKGEYVCPEPTRSSTQASSSRLPSSTPVPAPISTDGACGSGSPTNATCPGSGFGSCCSNYGWCGDTSDHCAAGNCYSGACLSPVPNSISTDGSCGPNSAVNATCGGSGFGTCCSNYGWCGDSAAHCGLGNCYSGACETAR